MNTAATTDFKVIDVEEINELQPVYADTEKLISVFQIQGMVTPGHSLIDYPGFSEKNIYMPNFEKDLGETDSGGQTAHVFQKAYYFADSEHGNTPTLMFAMSSNPDSTEPKIVTHAENMNIVYLPFSILKDAGITIEDCENMGDGRYMAPKEMMVAHRETLFPRIAQAATDFIKNNVSNYQDKNIILDGDYIDGCQTALHTRELLKNGMKEQAGTGQVIAVGTPHTLGANKLNSKLSEAHSEITDILKMMVEDSQLTNEQCTSIIDNTPLFQQWEEFRQMFADGAEPEELADLIPNYVRLEQESINTIAYSLQHYGVEQGLIDKFKEDIKANGLSGLSQKFSFADRLTMEGANNIVNFDGVVSVGESEKEQMAEWSDHGMPLRFILNGINENIFRHDVLDGVSQQTIKDAVRELYANAYVYTGQDSTPEVSDEQLEGTNFVSVARLDERKGILDAIKAFAQWAEAHPEDRGCLALVSNKPKEPINPDSFAAKVVKCVEELHKQHPELNLLERVKLLPKMKAHEIRMVHELQKAVGVGSSVSEPWGMVMVENVASGIPCVASDGYAAATYLESRQGDGEKTIRLYTSPATAGANHDACIKEFAEQMGEISDNYDTYKQHTQKASEYAVENFKWSVNAQTFMQYYDDLLGRIPANDIHQNMAVFTDLDGTLTPNIHQDEREAHAKAGALQVQMHAIRKAGGVVVASTGRTIEQLKNDALMDDYPVDYVICNVGTEIYQRVGNEFVPMQEYQEFLSTPPEGKTEFNPEEIKFLIEYSALLHQQGEIEIEPQPQEELAGPRLGYYARKHAYIEDPEANIIGQKRYGRDVKDVILPLSIKEKEQVEAMVKHVIEDKYPDMDYQVIVSYDEKRQDFNVDIMSSKANKGGAINFLLGHLKEQGKTVDSTFVMGDSGNDTAMMKPEIYKKHGIEEIGLCPVGNAHEDLKKAVHAYDNMEGVQTFVDDNAYNFNDPQHGGPGAILNNIQTFIDPSRKQAVEASQVTGDKNIPGRPEKILATGIESDRQGSIIDHSNDIEEGPRTMALH